MTGPLDMSKDPDRFDPDADQAARAAGPVGPLDMSQDPDRFDPDADRTAQPGRGRTLPELLGEGSYEDERNNLTWLYGLIGVIGFLVLVSVLVQLGDR